VPAYSAEDYRQRRLAELDIAARSGALPPGLLARWERSLEDVSRWRFVATPTHGDLAAAHILVDRVGARGPAHARVSGLTDWGEACVADPADDLAWVVLTADEDAVDTVLEAYAMARREQPDRHLLERARLAGELALVRWLNAGLAADDSAVVDEAQQAIRSLAYRLETASALAE
jgi:aminoglycoside phosphotransferase (APT) family kinase protein